MSVLGIDFETFWSVDYSLGKMTTAEYVHDRRFECFGAAVAYERHAVRWLRPDGLRTFLAALNPTTTTAYAHNAQFDGLVLQEHFGFRPVSWCDTMALAQPLVVPFTGRADLGSVVQHLGLGEKRPAILHKTRGRRWHELTLDEREAMAAYACEDATQMREVLRVLAPRLPAVELAMIDWTVRAYLRTPFRLDTAVLETELVRIRREKQELLERVGLVDRTALMSTKGFKELLEGQGVEVEMKEGKNGPIPALAKADPFMRSLLEHEDGQVQALAAARLGHKSTINQTRCETLLRLAALDRPIGAPLRYWAAHTGRWGGTDSQNWQNLERRDDRRGKGTIRKALITA